MRTRTGVILGLGILLFAPGPGLGETPAHVAIATTPHFAFSSDFEPNLNDALIAAGTARRFGKPELFQSGVEAECFGKLPPAARAAWNSAAGWYREIVSSSGSNDDQRYLIRVQLAGFDEELKDAGARQYAGIAQAFRAAAAPAYRACRWKAQDEKNRRWIEELKPRLAAVEARIAPRLEQLYQRRWDGLPIPVDIVETVDFSGANTILHGAAGGHLLISNEYEGAAKVEVVFHEASHLLMNRDAPVRQALDGAAKAAGWRVPGDLWHVVLFYTTGEAVRPFLEEGGQPPYTPMVFAIFDRGAWPGYRKPIETAWRPYVEGRRALSESSASLIEALRKPEPTPAVSR